MDVAVVEIDTCLDPDNRTGFRSPAQIEAVISKMDLVVTTRLHGLVLSLKNGVPVVAVDPVKGGQKVLRQAETLAWPHRFTPETASEKALSDAIFKCLRPGAAAAAREVGERARQALKEVEITFASAARTAVSCRR